MKGGKRKEHVGLNQGCILSEEYLSKQEKKEGTAAFTVCHFVGCTPPSYLLCTTIAALGIPVVPDV